MPELAGAPVPTQVEVRISALDFARGIALFGILLMNITGFGLPGAYSNPTVYGGATGADLWSWIIITMGFEGTQRGIFSLLFGAGVVLMTKSLDRSGIPNAQDLFFRRNLWLVVFGLIHAYLLLWIGEILFFYGVTALFVYGLRNAPTRVLVGIAVGGLLLQGAWNLGETLGKLEAHEAFVAADAAKQAGDSLTAEQTGAIETWQGMQRRFTPDSARLAKDVAAHQGGYVDVLTFQASDVFGWQSYSLYRHFFDIFSMMLLGIVVLRNGIITATRSTGTYLAMAVVGYGIGLAVNYYEVRTILDSEFSLLGFSRADVTYDLGRLAMTAGHLGVIMLVARSGVLQWLQRALAAVGRMAFTNYISHSIICAFVFYGFGAGLYGELSRHQLYYVVAAIWVFQLIVSPLWLRRYRFGPLEFAWRWLTYGSKPLWRASGP